MKSFNQYLTEAKLNKTEQKVLDDFKKSNIKQRSVQSGVGEDTKFKAVVSLNKKGLIKIIERKKDASVVPDKRQGKVIGSKTVHTEIITYELK